MLGEDIRGVFSTFDLSQIYPAASDLVLKPQALGVDAAELPEPVPATDADGGRGVGPHSDLQVNAQVAEQTLVAEAHPSGLDCAIVLGLAG